MKQSLPNPPAEHLRKLLRRYYDGNTTPAEDQTIMELLAREECHTEEFAADRQLFAALSNTKHMVPAPPATLGKALSEMTQEHFRQQRRRPVLYALSAFVAAACLIGIVVTFPGNNHPAASTDTTLSPTTEMIAEAIDSTINPENQTLVEESPAAPAEETTDQTSTAKPPATATQSIQIIRKRTAPRKEIHIAQAENEPESELTPEQAARISQAALMAMARTMAGADGICRASETRITSAVDNTMQKLSSQPRAIQSNI